MQKVFVISTARGFYSLLIRHIWQYLIFKAAFLFIFPLRSQPDVMKE